jgi:Stage II sporulation protein E (SpoIIE)/GAF domain
MSWNCSLLRPGLSLLDALVHHLGDVVGPPVGPRVEHRLLDVGMDRELHVDRPRCLSPCELCRHGECVSKGAARDGVRREFGEIERASGDSESGRVRSHDMSALPDGRAGAIAERMRDIDALTDAGLARLTVEELLVELLDRVREILAADTAAVQGVRVPLGRVSPGASPRPCRRRRSRTSTTRCGQPAAAGQGHPVPSRRPLLAGGRLLGALHVGTVTPRRFDDEDAHLLQMVADRVALATQASPSETERNASLVMQRSLLLDQLPDVAGFETAVRYVPRCREPGQMATAIVACLDADSDAIRVARAGHVAPVMARRDGPGRFLDLAIGPPLGVARSRPRPTTTVQLPPGAVICFYTDGLIEPRDDRLDDCTEQLCDTVTADPVEQVCSRVMARLIGVKRAEEDVALPVLRRTAH